MYWNPLKFDRMEMEIVRDGVFFKIYFGDVGWQWNPPAATTDVGKGWRLDFSGVCVIGEWGSGERVALGLVEFHGSSFFFQTIALRKKKISLREHRLDFRRKNRWTSPW